MTEEGNDEEYTYTARDDTESIAGDVQKDPEVYYRENGLLEPTGEGDTGSVLSYNVEEDHIPSLHQRVGGDSKEREVEEVTQGETVEKMEGEMTKPLESEMTKEVESEITRPVLE